MTDPVSPPFTPPPFPPPPFSSPFDSPLGAAGPRPSDTVELVNALIDAEPASFVIRGPSGFVGRTLDAFREGRGAGCNDLGLDSIAKLVGAYLAADRAESKGKGEEGEGKEGEDGEGTPPAASRRSAIAASFTLTPGPRGAEDGSINIVVSNTDEDGNVVGGKPRAQLDLQWSQEGEEEEEEEADGGEGAGEPPPTMPPRRRGKKE